VLPLNYGSLLSAILGTANSTSDYTFKILYRSYFMDNSANIELQMYSDVLLTVLYVFVCVCVLTNF
jgi:hypothetical protein